MVIVTSHPSLRKLACSPANLAFEAVALRREANIPIDPCPNTVGWPSRHSSFNGFESGQECMNGLSLDCRSLHKRILRPIDWFDRRS